MILPMLREIQNLGLSTDRQFSGLSERFERMEVRLANMREAANGASVLGRYAAAQVGERLEAIE